mgnify:CR=1 FL=1
MLFQVPPDRVKSEGAYAGPWPGAKEFPLAALTPRGVDHLFVLGGCADVSRAAAAKLLRPLNGIRLGQRVGAAAAQEAASRQFAAANQLVVGGLSGPASIQAEVGEMLEGLRWHPSEGAIRSPARGLPVLGRDPVKHRREPRAPTALELPRQSKLLPGLEAPGATGGQLGVDTVILGMTAVFIAYSFIGGLVASAWTDFFQGFLIIALSFMLIPPGLALVGGMDGLRETLSPHQLSLATPQGIGPWVIAVLTLNGLIGIMAQPNARKPTVDTKRNTAMKSVPAASTWVAQ